jgi:hypothetical protein
MDGLVAMLTRNPPPGVVPNGPHEPVGPTGGVQIPESDDVTLPVTVICTKSYVDAENTGEAATPPKLFAGLLLPGMPIDVLPDMPPTV